MRALNAIQHINLKGFFIILFIFCCVFYTSTGYTATLDLNNLNGQQIMKNLQNKKLSLSQASQILEQKTQLPIKDATKLIQVLQNGGKIDLKSAGNLLDGLMNGKSGINTANIKSAIDMVKNLQSGLASPTAIAGLINQVAGGVLPPEVGKILGAIKDLGNLANIKKVSDIFKNPAITKVLGNALNKALGSTLSKVEIPKEVTKIIGDITKIAVNPEALQQQVTQAIATAITDALKKAAPELAKALEGLLGGQGGLAKAISSALGGGGGDDKKNEKKKEGPSCKAKCGAANECGECATQINRNHQNIRAHVTSEFEQHRNWIVTTYFLENILPAMMLMSEQLTTTMMQQTQIIGTFFDAKHQLETQRLFQQMTAKAHKDYHPSESLCVIGTNVRSLAASERTANLGQLAFANRMLQRQLSNGDTLSMDGEESDRRSRVNLFIKKFCNKTDYGEGLKLLCKNSGKNKKQINMDVDYTSAFENKLTLNINFTKDSADLVTDDEENIFALGANLFGNTVLPTISDEILANNKHEPYDAANLYLDIRALAAKRSVAQNSFAAITALKSEGDKEVAPFLKAILLESGVNPEDIEKRLGEKPSYFAQMEVMTKDIYQNPSFYTELYDKPVNIERKGAALQAIELMQDRDIYKSLLRSEAVLATLIETLISKEHARVSRDLSNVPLKGTKFTSSGGKP